MSLHLTVPATPHNYTLSLHDALPISRGSSCASSGRPVPEPMNTPCAPGLRIRRSAPAARRGSKGRRRREPRSEEHTSELQSQFHLVCRLLLEKKKIK